MYTGTLLRSMKWKERSRVLLRLFRYSISIIILIGLLGFSPVGDKLVGHSEVALADSDPVIAAAGDIACDPAHPKFNGGNGTLDACRQKSTSDLLVDGGFAAVLPLGDIQYYCGGLQAFEQSYDLSWGRVKDITRPVVGNHEYITTPDPNNPSTGCDLNNTAAAGYFDYFGAAAGNQGEGYYSYDIGDWHIIALNSNCTDAGGCDPSSPQGQWLQDDLAAHSNVCTLAYWHIPLFSSGGRAANNSRQLWQILYNHDVDLILNGHDHIYERFVPQKPDGTFDLVHGIREFIVGTGGANLTPLETLAANSEVRNASTYGILKLALHPTSYDWEFVPEPGKTFTDSGTALCDGDTQDTTPPAAPSNLTASAADWNEVHLNWTAATDDIALFGYHVLRDGVLIGAATGTSYVDTTTEEQTTYSYSVVAVDGAELASDPSNTATVTTPMAPIGLFSDDFETNSLARWTFATNLTVQSQEVFTGSYAARGTSSGASTYAYKQLSVAQDELYYRIYFKKLNQPQTTNLLKFRTALGGSIVGVFVSNTGNLGYRNDIAGMTVFGTTPVTSGVWHELQVHVVINGPDSQTEVWLDGNQIDELSNIEAFGTNPIGRLQLGENAPGVNFDVAYDNVIVDTQFIPSEITTTYTPTPTATQTATPTQTGLPTALTFSPTADTYIWAERPTVNFGAAAQIVTDNSPIRHMLLKFAVSGIGNRSVLSAKLRLYCVDPSPFGGSFYRVADTTWSEGTVNWNTAPPADPNSLGMLGAVAAGNWYEVDVTSLVNGDGTYSLKINSTSADGAYYSTKEGAAGFAPQLVVTTSTEPAPTITPTFTPTSTPTATSTSTATASAISPGSILFGDGFETGNLSQWTSAQGLIVQNQQVASGSYAAQGTSAAGGATYARKSLSPAQTDLYYRTQFNVISRGTTTFNLMKLRTASGPLLSVSINNLGNLSYRNDVAGTSVNSTTSVSNGNWHTLQVHVRIAGPASQVEVWYDDVLLPALSRTEALGINPIGVLQLGENTPGLTYDIAFDEVAASPDFIELNTTPTPTPTATQTPTSTATLPSSLAFTSSADTYIWSDQPAVNFGSSTQIVTDNSPIRDMLLKFTVSDIGNRSVLSAKLRLYCVDPSPFGGAFHRVGDSTWSEGTVNWNTAPTADVNSLAALGAVAAGNWYEVDVTSLVTGDGTFSLRVNSTSADGAYYSTKEGAAGFAPQLIVQTSP